MKRKERKLSSGITKSRTGKQDCVRRTKCCASEGGKKIDRICCVCRQSNPEMIWVSPDATKCVTSTEPREMRWPAAVPASGGYVPFSARIGSQYASCGGSYGRSAPILNDGSGYV